MNLEEAGYGQANLVDKIVSLINAELNHQYNMCEHIPDEYTAPPHATVGNTTNNTILQQVLAYNQELMRQLYISNFFPEITSIIYQDLLLDHTKDNLVPPCEHIKITHAGKMGMETTMVVIAIPNLLVTRMM